VKLLVIRFSSIGDIVLTTPVIRCLKRQYPEAEIHFLVRQSFRSAIEHNPHISRLHTYESHLKALADTLKKEDFDLIIDLQKNFRSRKISRMLEKPRLSFPKLNVLKWIYVHTKINLLPDKSIVDRYFRAVRRLKVTNDGQGLEFFIPESARTGEDDIPMSHWDGFTGCVIGGSFFTKKFPVDKWIAFCRESPFPVILLGGPQDREAGEAIAQAVPGKVYNACGKFSLLESADLVRRAKVIVSNDTGLMHIAAAFRKPIISLWGNTAPDMGMFPYYGANNRRAHPAPLSAMMENKTLGCHPCSKLGFDRCPKKHFRCMYDLPVASISGSVQQYWKET